jgi:hypothetical protein
MGEAGSLPSSGRAFARRLKPAQARIVAVAVDMAGGYTHWVERHFPDAAIVYDHFHVIKRMDERLGQVRREAMRNAATDSERKRIKDRRWLLLHGIEQLDQDARRELRDLWDANRPIAIACILKEKLRWIYSGCTDWESAACHRTGQLVRPRQGLGHRPARHRGANHPQAIARYPRLLDNPPDDREARRLQ